MRNLLSSSDAMPFAGHGCKNSIPPETRVSEMICVKATRSDIRYSRLKTERLSMTRHKLLLELQTRSYSKDQHDDRGGLLSVEIRTRKCFRCPNISLSHVAVSCGVLTAVRTLPCLSRTEVVGYSTGDDLTRVYTEVACTVHSNPC